MTPERRVSFLFVGFSVEIFQNRFCPPPQKKPTALEISRQAPEWLPARAEQLLPRQVRARQLAAIPARERLRMESGVPPLFPLVHHPGKRRLGLEAGARCAD